MFKQKYYELIDLIGSWITGRGYLKYYQPKEGDIIIDLGAYFGYFSLKMAEEIGPKGKIFAFEPNPINYGILCRRISRKGYTNIIAINKIVIDQKKKLPFTNSYYQSKIDENIKGSINIETTTLDAEMEKYRINKVDFIKMDIEGSELEAISGGNAVLKITDQLAIACYHRRNGKRTGDILEPIIKKAGFMVKVGYPLHRTLYAWK